MQRDSSPWSAPPGRRHDAGHTDEGDYGRRGEPVHEPAASGGHRSARGSNYGDWRGEPGHEPDPYGGGGGWGHDAGPPDRYKKFTEDFDSWRSQRQQQQQQGGGGQTSGGDGTSSAANTGSTTTGGHNAAVPGG